MVLMLFLWFHGKSRVVDILGYILDTIVRGYCYNAEM